ncbi:CBS domain-containing protein [Streptomyces echinatus]
MPWGMSRPPRSTRSGAGFGIKPPWASSGPRSGGRTRCAPAAALWAHEEDAGRHDTRPRPVAAEQAGLPPAAFLSLLVKDHAEHPSTIASADDSGPSPGEQPAPGYPAPEHTRSTAQGAQALAQHVRGFMTSTLVTVEPQASVAAVARLMRDQNVGAAAVTDHERLPGLVSDRDLVVRRSVVCSGSTPSARSPSAPTRTWIRGLCSRPLRRRPDAAI